MRALCSAEKKAPKMRFFGPKKNLKKGTNHEIVCSKCSKKTFSI